MTALTEQRSRAHAQFTRGPTASIQKTRHAWLAYRRRSASIRNSGPPLSSTTGRRTVEVPLQPRSGALSLCPQEHPKAQPMRNEERRDNDGWDEERRPQRLGTDADADLGLVDCVQEISRTPDVEQPHNRNGPNCMGGERSDCDDGENGRHQIAVGRRSGESRWQRGRYDTRDQKAQPNEPEGMRNRQRDEGILTRDGPQSRPDVQPRDDAEGNEAHQHAEPKYRRRCHGAPSRTPDNPPQTDDLSLRDHLVAQHTPVSI